MYQKRTKTPMLHFRSTQNKTNLNNNTEFVSHDLNLYLKCCRFQHRKIIKIEDKLTAIVVVSI